MNWPLNAQTKSGKAFFGRQLFHQDLIHKAPRIVNDDEWSFNSQVSSQWDGLRHFAYQKEEKFYNGVTLEDIHGKGFVKPAAGEKKWTTTRDGSSSILGIQGYFPLPPIYLPFSTPNQILNSRRHQKESNTRLIFSVFSNGQSRNCRSCDPPGLPFMATLPIPHSILRLFCHFSDSPLATSSLCIFSRVKFALFPPRSGPAFETAPSLIPLLETVLIFQQYRDKIRRHSAHSIRLLRLPSGEE